MTKRSPGADLARAKLESSALTLEQGLGELGMRVVKANAVDPSWPDVWGLHLVYHDLDGRPRTDTSRLRLLEEPKLAFGAKPDKALRYLQPAKTPPAAYFPTCFDWRAIAEDPDQGIVITEGEFKAASFCLNMQQACIGLGGVSSWRTAKLAWSLLPELEAFRWHQRDVVICFDSDAKTNPDIAAATHALHAKLRSLGAHVRVADLPPVDGLAKTGLDDFLLHRGAPDLQQVLADAKGDELTEKLWELNARFSFVLDPGLIYDEVLDTRYAPEKFKGIAANRWAEERRADRATGKLITRRVQVAPAWVEWECRREVDRIVYEPGAPRFVRRGKALNEWPGWGCDPLKGSVKPWQELLERLFANESDAVRDWFERWCLYPIKYPGAKLFSSVGFWSHGHGRGKTSVPVTLGRIYGRNYKKITQADLESDFNSWAATRQFALIDDVDSHDSRSKASVMKSLITEEELHVNIKHVPQYTVEDVCNFMMTSNFADAYYVEADDRRWFIHEVQVERDPEFFDRYYKWAGDPKVKPVGTWPRRGEWRPGDPWQDAWATGPRHLFYHALHEVDFSEFKPTEPPPMTKAKQAMIELVRTELDAWLAGLKADPDARLASFQVPVFRDLLTAGDLAVLFDQVRRGPQVTGQTIGRVASQHFSVACGGAHVRLEETAEAERYFVVRNAKRWTKASPEQAAQHVRDARTREAQQRPGRY